MREKIIESKIKGIDRNIEYLNIQVEFNEKLSKEPGREKEAERAIERYKGRIKDHEQEKEILKSMQK